MKKKMVLAMLVGSMVCGAVAPVAVRAEEIPVSEMKVVEETEIPVEEDVVSTEEVEANTEVESTEIAPDAEAENVDAEISLDDAVSEEETDSEMASADETLSTLESETEDELLTGSSVSNLTAGIFIANLDKNGMTAGLVVNGVTSKANLEYRWLAYDEAKGVWLVAQDWTVGNEWVAWKPETYGKYVIQAEVREVGTTDAITASTGITYHPNIKGECQMPYENGGYLIGVESYDNQNYSYELLVLDCTLLQEGKDAWIYTTGKCKTNGNAFWTVWQPEYGYYWTLFRVYDAEGNLIDEDCYGFENINAPAGNGNSGASTASTVDPNALAEAITQFESHAGHGAHDLDEYQNDFVWLYNRNDTDLKRTAAKAGLKAYQYGVANGLTMVQARKWGYGFYEAVKSMGSEEAVIQQNGTEWMRGDLWLLGNL